MGKAGQRSLERSALVEAVAQLKCALDQIATLPSTSSLRRERIKLQVALITPLIHVNGWGASETKATVEQARLLLEQAETLGESPEDPLLLFSVLYGAWAANAMVFNADVCLDLSAQFLALAKKQKTSGSADARAFLSGHFFVSCRRPCGGKSALRPNGCALRSDRTSLPSNALWRGH